MVAGRTEQSSAAHGPVGFLPDPGELTVGESTAELVQVEYELWLSASADKDLPARAVALVDAVRARQLPVTVLRRDRGGSADSSDPGDGA